jgi:hypothetical protein
MADHTITDMQYAGGADATGRMDSTAAINAAAAAANGDPGGRVLWPPGTYKVSAPPRNKYTLTFGNASYLPGSTWSLSFGGQTAPGLLPTLSASDLQTAVQGLVGGAPDVQPAGTNTFTITLNGVGPAVLRQGLTADPSGLKPMTGPITFSLTNATDGTLDPNSPTNGPMLVLYPGVSYTGDLDADGNPLATAKVADWQGDYSAILGPAGMDGDTAGASVFGLAFDFNVAKNPATWSMAQPPATNVRRLGVAATHGAGISLSHCLFSPADTYACVSLYPTSEDPADLAGAYVADCVVRDVGNPTFSFSSTFFLIAADNSVVQNNAVYGNFTRTAVVTAYWVWGNGTRFVNNYAERCQFGVQLVSGVARGSNQTCVGNNFRDVLSGWQLRPAYRVPAGETGEMDHTTISNNTITVNELSWTADLNLHPQAADARGVIDVFSQSAGGQTGQDGANLTGLTITNNVIVFTNADPLWAAAPLSAFRFVKGGNNPCTVNDLVLQGNLVSGFDAAQVLVRSASGVYLNGTIDLTGAPFAGREEPESRARAARLGVPGRAARTATGRGPSNGRADATRRAPAPAVTVTAGGARVSPPSGPAHPEG